MNHEIDDTTTIKQHKQHEQMGGIITKTPTDHYHHYSLMIEWTKPSQITSLHPAVRLAVLHDAVQLEFRTTTTVNDTKNNHNHHKSTVVDPNIWY